MPLQHAVLALLNAGPTYGYDLRRRFEAAVGPEWHGLNVGHLNQILERLRRDKAVRTTHVPTTWGPDRVVHEITPTGLAVLAEWMLEPTIRTAGFRDDFILKVLAAGLVGTESLTEICTLQREARQADLQSLLVAQEEHSVDTLTGLTIAAAIVHIRAELALIDQSESIAVDKLAQTVASHEEPDTEYPVASADEPAIENSQTRRGGSRLRATGQ